MTQLSGFVDALRERLSIAEVIGRRLDWDKRRSNPGKGDYWACCPFHGEKTPSFHVEDRKGFFYCFGCHEKGDIVNFLMKLDRLSFREAVEVLAREAGMEVPQQSPADREREQKRGGLIEAMDAAQRFYRAQLGSAAAREARAYLDRRGLTQDTLARFGLGYALRGRALTEHLQGKGFETGLLIEAGLTGKGDDGSVYDRFRDRITFPIHDARGRMIAFGGRAMAADAQAKYLNSPETPLFSKSRTLFNLSEARTACGKGAPLIVAEGYMDVIALHQFGFEGAVAPLGTALTEDQLGMLWRCADEPILALDGDTAGQRAADRAARLALPRLEPGKTLRFAILPSGQDPDDLLRASGPAAMHSLISGAETLSQFLWRLESEARSLDTPERRADFDQRVRALLDTIQNPDIRSHYREAFREKRRELFRPAPESRGGFTRGRDTKFPVRRLAALPETKRSRVAADTARDAFETLEEAILREAFAAPPELIEIAETLQGMQFRDSVLDSLRGGLISAAFDIVDQNAEITAASLLPAIAKRLPVEHLDALTTLVKSSSREGGAHLNVALDRYRALCARELERADMAGATQDDVAMLRLTRAKIACEEALGKLVPTQTTDEKVTVQDFIDRKGW